MGERRLYLDVSAGERRGVVVLDGRPERLLIARDSDRAQDQPGARLMGRVRRVERALATAFIDIGADPDAVLPLTGPAKSLAEGAWVEVEVTAPPWANKGAVVRLIGEGEGPPRVLRSAKSLTERLQSFAPSEPIVSGREARNAADDAEFEVLSVVHSLSSGGTLSIEPTRGLVAMDVDVGPARGDPRRAAARANAEAIAAAARLLRLKGLAGPIAMDLAGQGHDGDALKTAAKAAFAPDQPGVVFGPLSRFGVWTLALPRRARPISERLLDADGRLSLETRALRLLRLIEREAGPGERVEARAEPTVAERAQALAPLLAAVIGGRFTIIADPTLPLETPVVRPM